MKLDVRNVRELSRYGASAGGELAGYAAYRLTADAVVFDHTVVEPRFKGQGIGSRLVRAALDDVRGRGETVVPLCSSVRDFVNRHPEYADLVVG